MTNSLYCPPEATRIRIKHQDPTGRGIAFLAWWGRRRMDIKIIGYHGICWFSVNSVCPEKYPRHAPAS
jgi:hypothetical protein